ncbi:MAG TPA: hypothetical protein VGK20_00465 [Candidatus Binatia bacterium]|jgi:hypothetical protein
MPPVPISENDAIGLDAGEGEFDPQLGVYTLHLAVPRAESAYFRLVIEAWEDWAVPRTMERFYGPAGSESLLVVLAVPDSVQACLRALARLGAEVNARQVPTSPAMAEAVRRNLLDADAADPA